jgi:hypothetical protein
VALAALAVATLLFSFAVALSGGFSFGVAGFWIRAHDPRRTLLFGIVCGLAALLLHRYSTPIAARPPWWRYVEAASPWVATAAAAGTLVVVWRFGAFVAGGSDAQGYVSQAHLWASGTLHTEVPLAREVPWPDAVTTFSPLGYIPARYGQPAIVPTYPPGLPLLMALFITVFGKGGEYAVVPLLAGLSIVLAYWLGRRLDGPVTGAATAVLLACSPVFLLQSLQPMSDVPATAWWLAAVVLALGSGTPRLVAAGLASSIAILTRPVLVPVAMLVALFVLRRRGVRAAVAYCAGVVPGCAALGVIQWHLYGSPLVSGYGNLAGAFALANARVNLARYGGWLLETQTAFLLLALIAPWLVLARRRALQPDADIGWLLLALPLVVFGCYLFYIPFTDWTYLRFLLPALPATLALATMGGIAVVRRVVPGASAALIVLALFTWLGHVYVNTARDRGVLGVASFERRYVAIARYIDKVVPQDAVLLSMQESGSLRHYASRTILRWDFLDRDWLDRAIDTLRAKGRPAYLVLEDWEAGDFRARFTGHSRIGSLDRPPIAQFRGAVTVTIYGPL